MKLAPKLFLQLIIIQSIVLTSCQNDNNWEPLDHSVFFDLNGEPVVFLNAKGTINNDSVSNIPVSNISINADFEGGEIELFIQSETTLQTGEYSFTAADNRNLRSYSAFSYVTLVNQDTLPLTYISTDDYEHRGSVIITEIDLLSKTISGTFDGTVINRVVFSDGNRISSGPNTIKNGAFHNVRF